MANARGIFVGLDQTTLNELRADAIDWIKNGRLKNSTLNSSQFGKDFPMTPQDVLFEVQYAEDQASGRPRPRRTKASFNPGFDPTTSNPQYGY